ncbi:group II intron reverse transcriptase/maturase [Flindersiella endophytica]
MNGPEDGELAWDLDRDLKWDQVDWEQVEDNVRRLRQRIFTAVREGDLKRVRNLQKLMLRSLSNTLVSVRRVTQHNAGRRTPGVDGHVVFTDRQRSELTRWVQTGSLSWTARPARRVYIPKPGGKQRPLGIPVVIDRVLQARMVNTLEPEWEARFEARSYGFRPGRGCHDAIAQLFQSLKGKNPRRLWVLDADLAAAFDWIDHDQLMAAIGEVPGRELIRGWLKAGVIEKNHLQPTERGTPQGGVISPLLLNIALHGMEEAAGMRYRNTIRADYFARSSSPILVRYADDLVVLCLTREQAEQVKARLGAWLAPKGLAFNEDKTRIVHVDAGFDFLGFTIRRFGTRSGRKLFIKPSQTAVKRVRKRIREVVRSLHGAGSPSAVMAALNPIVRGWSAYYRTVVSSKIFGQLDSAVWRRVYRWALKQHPNKSKSWVVKRYFGTFNPSRNDRWVFGDRDSGAYLVKFAWTKIVRHQLVEGKASVDDPTLTEYWAKRRRRNRPPLGAGMLRILESQKGRCWLCGDLLFHADSPPQTPEEWEQWAKAARRAVKMLQLAYRAQEQPDNTVVLRLVHPACKRNAETAGTSHA